MIKSEIEWFSDNDNKLTDERREKMYFISQQAFDFNYFLSDEDEALAYEYEKECD